MNDYGILKDHQLLSFITYNTAFYSLQQEWAIISHEGPDLEKL